MDAGVSGLKDQRGVDPTGGSTIDPIKNLPAKIN